jgi:N-ethylmaleimide reductase
MSKLFTSTSIGFTNLQHRVVMAPLTRLRASEGAMPNALMEEYYGQRASHGGLIISEATFVSAGGNGYLGAPGIHDDAQIAGWKRITDAVHAKGGRIFLQLWHVGRVSHTDLQPDGGQPVAPSALPFEGVVFTSQGWVPTTPARELSVADIVLLVEDYRAATRRAVSAGFDGVEIHAANGYLVDQFLQDGSNQRTDQYGGSVENRARFLLELVEAAGSIIGPNRVAVRLSPSSSFGGMHDSDPQALFTYISQQLDHVNLAYLHVIEPRVQGSENDLTRSQDVVAVPLIRQRYKGVLLAAGGFTPASAEATVGAGDVDLIAFGRDFIANPDLPARIRDGLPLNKYNRETFYGGAGVGYTDYPSYNAA